MPKLEVFFSSDYLGVVSSFLCLSLFVNLIRLFICDDTLQSLGNLHVAL